MSWIYCDCGEGLERPTDLEVLSNSYVCPHCGEDNSNHIADYERREVVERVLHHLEVIEKHLDITPPE